MRRTHVVVSLIVLVIAAGAVDAAGLRFTANLSTAQEVGEPDPASVTIDEGHVEIEFNGDLSGAKVTLKVVPSTNVTAAHLHCGRPGTNGTVAFGLISPGTFRFDGDVASGVLTNADFNGNDCVPEVGRPVNNIAALALAMRDGLIYMNVHTVNNLGGEVRGQLLRKPPRRQGWSRQGR